MFYTTIFFPILLFLLFVEIINLMFYPIDDWKILNYNFIHIGEFPRIFYAILGFFLCHD